jgi:hypothetical protein
LFIDENEFSHRRIRRCDPSSPAASRCQVCPFLFLYLILFYFIFFSNAPSYPFERPASVQFHFRFVPAPDRRPSVRLSQSRLPLAFPPLVRFLRLL